jgi:hypothetical protein
MDNETLIKLIKQNLKDAAAGRPYSWALMNFHIATSLKPEDDFTNRGRPLPDWAK